MQRIADVLGMDPWELRLRNATRAGDMTPTGVRVPDPSAVSTLLAAADAAGVRLPDGYRCMSDTRAAEDAVPGHLKDVVSARRPAEELEI